MRERRQGLPTLALACALAASIVVHAGILLVNAPGGAIPGVVSIAPRIVEAVLAPPATAPEPAFVTARDPSVIVAASSPAAGPVPPVSAAPEAAPATRAPKAITRGVAAIGVKAEPIVDRTRLGDYLARQLAEFRAEIDRPVRIVEPIVAQYPPAALRSGREDSVVVWAVVDHLGVAEKVDVIEGTPEFADQVVSAVYAARFFPAEQNLEAIRYPIALEFHFRLSAPPALAKGGDGK